MYSKSYSQIHTKPERLSSCFVETLVNVKWLRNEIPCPNTLRCLRVRRYLMILCYEMYITATMVIKS